LAQSWTGFLIVQLPVAAKHPARQESDGDRGQQRLPWVTPNSLPEVGYNVLHLVRFHVIRRSRHFVGGGVSHIVDSFAAGKMVSLPMDFRSGGFEPAGSRTARFIDLTDGLLPQIPYFVNHVVSGIGNLLRSPVRNGTDTVVHCGVAH